jgi:protein FrlC
MKLSTATSVLVNYPLHAAVDEVIKAGFDGVDVWAGRPHLFRKDYSAEEIAALSRRMQTAGLTPVTVMPAFYRYPFSLSSPIETIRSDSIAYVQECMQNAVAIGCSQVLIVPTHSLVGQSLEDARSRFAASLATLTHQAETLGVHLGIEVLYPLLTDIVHSTAQAMAFIREIGSPNLGVVLDSGHLRLSGEQLAAALDVVGDRLIEVHLNDNDGIVQQNAIPGDGVIDFTAWVKELSRIDYTGFLTLELGGQYWPDPQSALLRAGQRVRSLLREVPA